MSITSREDKGKRPMEESDYITLSIKSEEGGEISYTIERSSKLQVITDDYCDRQNKCPEDIVFSFNGGNLDGRHTPDDLEMEDGDQIDAAILPDPFEAW